MSHALALLLAAVLSILTAVNLLWLLALLMLRSEIGTFQYQRGELNLSTLRAFVVLIALLTILYFLSGEIHVTRP